MLVKMTVKRKSPLIGIGVFGINSGILIDENVNNNQLKSNATVKIALYFIMLFNMLISPLPPSPSSPKTNAQVVRPI